MPTSVTLAADPPAVGVVRAGTWHASSIFGDPTDGLSRPSTNENGAPVTERSVLFVAYTLTTQPSGRSSRGRTGGAARTSALSRLARNLHCARLFSASASTSAARSGSSTCATRATTASTQRRRTSVILDIASTLQLSTPRASPAAIQRRRPDVTYTYTPEEHGERHARRAVHGHWRPGAAPTCGTASLAPSAQTSALPRTR